MTGEQFKRALRELGISQRQAVIVFDVSLSTINRATTSGQELVRGPIVDAVTQRLHHQRAHPDCKGPAS